MVDIKAYKNQDFKELEEKHSSTRLFIDPEFPACLHSISHTGKLDLTNKNGENILKYIEWRRPHEIVDRPYFVIDGFHRRDIGQGQLSNCWFVAAAGVLTLNTELIAHVIPFDQTFDSSEYTGMFHFRFWLFGEWTDVVIDDRLPCYNGNFVFCRNNRDSNELWAPLLEKAYAKVCGSYELMDGGQITDGLIDFTGGIDESILLKIPTPPPDFKEEIKRLLCKACARKSLVGCSINSALKSSDQMYLSNGLVAEHAFSVTQIRDLITPTGPVTLVRCLNPWNSEKEWNGDWSDNSSLWDSVAETEKRKFKFQILHDGEFWMSYDDFFNNFDEIQICHCRPDSLGVLGISTPVTKLPPVNDLIWHEEVFHGEWIIGESAGGSGLEDQLEEEYWTNPQYLIKLEFIDDGIEEKWCTMIIALMFKGERQRILANEDYAFIAFDVYKIKNDSDIPGHIERREKFYMTDLDEVGDSGEHTIYRSVSKRFKVRPGTYIIIPNTLMYGRHGEFFLRIFTEQAACQTVAVELTVNKENLTEAEIKRPKLEKKIENELDSTPESFDEETSEITDVNGTFSSLNVIKLDVNTTADNQEGYCTIQ